MAKKADHLVDRLSTRIGTEVERMSDGVAEQINATLLEDNRELDEPAFLDYWRTHWQDPLWRQKKYEQMGATGFHDATMRAFGVPRPPALGKLVRDGMARQAVNTTQAVEPMADNSTYQPPPTAAPGEGT